MSVEEIVKTSDELHGKLDVKGNYELLTKSFEGGAQHPDIMWRYGRSCYDVAQESTDKNERHELIKKALELVKAAVAAQPDNFAAHKWHGIVLSSYGDFIPTKEKIANAYVIRDEFKRATELNPGDSTALHCLGKWCYGVMQISWIERQAASLLFGTPPTSTYEESEKYFMASHKIAPAEAYNLLALGDVNYQQKKYPQAKQWYELAAGCPVVTENSKRMQKEALAKAAKC